MKALSLTQPWAELVVLGEKRWEAIRMTHECPKDGCGIDMPVHLLACRPHWYLIPRPIRKDVNRAFKNLEKARDRGGSLQKAVREYMAARKAAIECLNAE